MNLHGTLIDLNAILGTLIVKLWDSMMDTKKATLTEPALEKRMVHWLEMVWEGLWWDDELDVVRVGELRVDELEKMSC